MIDPLNAKLRVFFIGSFLKGDSYKHTPSESNQKQNLLSKMQINTSKMMLYIVISCASF